VDAGALTPPAEREPAAVADASRGASIDIQGISKLFGDVRALDGVDLTVAPGEFLSLLGESGSGKTTLLKILSGLERPSTGELYIDGRSTHRLPPEKRDIGVVFQDYALFPHMSVYENISFPLRMRRWSKAEIERAVDGIIELVGLQGLGKRGSGQLSGGQQQRVAIARALVFRPKVLLLDEPLSALDRNLREHMKAELKSLHQELGVTIVYVTHDQGEALALSDRIAVMRLGRIDAVDTPHRLYSVPPSRYIARFLGEANLLDGVIIDVGDRIRAECALGTVEVAPERVSLHAPAQGQPVTIALRPEALALRDDGPFPEGAVVTPCTVGQSLYAGSYVEYFVEPGPDKGQVRVVVPAATSRPYPSGHSTHLVVDPAEAVLVARDA
jgi:putative spermidine/putrescine transport system ATP-binding protein